MELLQINRISDLELFADCTRAELRQIDGLFTYLHLTNGQVLIHEGTTAQEFIIIAGGTTRVTRETSAGVKTVADVGSGNFLGEMALLNGAVRSATVTATSDLTVFVCSATEFQSMLSVAPSVAHKIWRTSLVRAEGLATAA